jgi:hypothetical protein
MIIKRKKRMEIQKNVIKQNKEVRKLLKIQEKKEKQKL